VLAVNLVEVTGVVAAAVEAEVVAEADAETLTPTQTPTTAYRTSTLMYQCLEERKCRTSIGRTSGQTV
jgi:hypothetical protein